MALHPGTCRSATVMVNVSYGHGALPSETEAGLKVACYLNGGNLCDTGHSTEHAPTTAEVGDLSMIYLRERQLDSVNGHSTLGPASSRFGSGPAGHSESLIDRTQSETDFGLTAERSSVLQHASTVGALQAECEYQLTAHMAIAPSAATTPWVRDTVIRR